ncbi:MAG TPA: hypothetical protein VKA76_03690 [Gammaproteobacteria bacterium]|nr:hypothetical protein [Gammaproteobacteria bacterium]
MSRRKSRRGRKARYFDETESFALMGRDVTTMGPLPGIPDGAIGRVVERAKAVELDNGGWQLGVEVQLNPEADTKTVDWVSRDEFFDQFEVR